MTAEGASDAARRGGVALTFDDGPDPVWTPRLLEALAAAGVQATFFVMGSAVARSPQVLRDVVAAGHDVQLHCHEHRRHTALTAKELAADTDRALATLEPFGVRPTRWRAPWGVVSSSTGPVAAARRLSLVRWTADTEDWAGEEAPALLARVADRLVAEAVILMHDGLGPGARRTGCAETVALVAPLVAAVRGAGLEPGPLPALRPRRSRRFARGAPARAGKGAAALDPDRVEAAPGRSGPAC